MADPMRNQGKLGFTNSPLAEVHDHWGQSQSPRSLSGLSAGLFAFWAAFLAVFFFPFLLLFQGTGSADIETCYAIFPLCTTPTIWGKVRSGPDRLDGPAQTSAAGNRPDSTWSSSNAFH